MTAAVPWIVIIVIAIAVLSVAVAYAIGFITDWYPYLREKRRGKRYRR